MADPLINGAAATHEEGKIHEGGPRLRGVHAHTPYCKPSSSVPDLDSSRGRGQVADGGFIFRD
jgi:hypothetical protein